MNSVDFGALTIRAGSGKRFLDPDMGRYRRRYNVRVRSDDTGSEIRFDFTASVHDEESGKIGLGPTELLYAFRCFVEDAAAGESTFADFAGDFGYDLDSYSARQVHKACRVSRVKFGKLFSDGRDPYAVVEQLTARGIK